MIEVADLRKSYGRFDAVSGVSFTVGKGEILGFLGPNGAGKTTTMRILTGYMPATSGRATVAGFDVFKSPLEAKSSVGYLPETPPVYPDLDVRPRAYIGKFGVSRITFRELALSGKIPGVTKSSW